jgi:mxaA protein
MTMLQRAGLAGFGLALSACIGLAAAQALPEAVPDLPRAYGYSVGDVVQRRVQLQLPPGWSLDLDALPRSRRPGQAIELRSARLEGDRLLLDYQVFLAPTEVRTLEMPPLMLRFVGPERVQGAEGAARGLRDVREVRVDAWPLTVAPLVPVEVSPREGLGAMRPDMPAAPIDTTPRQHRLLVLAALLLAVGAALTHLHLGLPWWGRRQRPFAQAWRQLRRWPERAHPEQARAAMKLMHAALNRSAGQVLFAGGVAAFVDCHPRFGPLQAALSEFFERSQATFFAVPAVMGAALTASADASTDAGTKVGTGATDIGWLKRLCRDCLDAERGAR